ncbi:MAG: hypothetical protein V4622_11590 [Bacteroidota bacterium]
MKKIIGILLLVFIANTSFSQNKKLNWLKADWEGEANQPLAMSQQDWPMEITFNKEKNSFQVNYASFPCGGNWKFIEGNKRKAVFIEELTSGKNKCAANIRIEIKKINKKKASITFYLPDSDIIDATGFIRKK